MLIILYSSLCATEIPAWTYQRISTDFSCFQKGFSSQEITDCISTIQTLQGIENAALVRIFLTQDDLFYDSLFPLSTEENRSLDTLCIELKNLQKEYTLSPIDFLIALSPFNRPLLLNQTTIPIFATAKEASNRKVILIPRFEKEPSHSIPWEQKIEKGFWQGSPTDGHYGFFDWGFSPRARLCLLSKNHKNLIDASFIKFLSGHLYVLESHDLVSEMTPIEVQNTYKYLFALDDASSCPDLEWQLFTSSLILKTTSHHIEWYFDGLIPGTHYLPIHLDMHDLTETLAWCHTHDKESKQIAKNGYLFANQYLTHTKKQNYLYRVLTEYTKLYRP